MRKRKKLFLAVTAALGLVAAACSSSVSSSTSSSTGGSSTKTITVGLLTDYTGLGASTNKSSVQGVQAGIRYAKDHGFTIKYVIGDTQTSPTAVSSAAKELVQQDHVDAVVSVSSLTFLTSSFLTQNDVPVVGVAEDSNEWTTAPNMFSAFGPTDATKVATTFGQFFKLEGAHKLGVLGYGISPQSADAAKAAAVSAQDAGLTAPYVNANFDFGSTNVQPIALAMKSDGVDAMTASVDSNTGLLLIDALRQSGANVKVALLPTGYGGDLEQAGPGALSSAQNVYFLSVFEPMELHTAATDEFQKYLKDVGVTGDPTYGEYSGYASIVLLVQALQADGGNTTPAKLIAALGGIHSFDAAGLLGSHTVDMANRKASPLGPGNCAYFTKLSGSKFDLVPGADPLCGSLTNQTVSSSS